MSISMSLEDNSGKVLNLMEDATIKALTKIGAKAETYAKGYAPVDTGRLRNSIMFEVNSSEMDVSLGSEIFYSVFQELGTRKMKAHPFLKPAMMNHTEEYKQILENNLKNA